jgi:UDP-glucuronate 4-epimerase
LFNIGNGRPVELLEFIRTLEDKLKKKAIVNYLPLQDGDVPETAADVADLESVTGFRPVTTIETGIDNFVTWYRDFYSVKQ